jgi:hypothetical protein
MNAPTSLRGNIDVGKDSEDFGIVLVASTLKGNSFSLEISPLRCEGKFTIPYSTLAEVQSLA